MADRGKGGEDGNIKIWVSWERKELFRWNKKTFFIIVFEGLSFGEKFGGPCVKNRSWSSLDYTFNYKERMFFVYLSEHSCVDFLDKDIMQTFSISKCLVNNVNVR